MKPKPVESNYLITFDMQLKTALYSYNNNYTVIATSKVLKFNLLSSDPCSGNLSTFLRAQYIKANISYDIFFKIGGGKSLFIKEKQKHNISLFISLITFLAHPRM